MYLVITHNGNIIECPVCEAAFWGWLAKMDTDNIYEIHRVA